MFNLSVFFKSFHYASQGIHHVWKHDQNFRIHLLIAGIVIAASIFFQVNPFEMGILGVMIVLVITTEMINSAIENMVDLITLEHRAEAKIAKDVASGMVLIASAGSVVVGILVFLPHIFRFLQISI